MVDVTNAAVIRVELADVEAFGAFITKVCGIANHFEAMRGHLDTPEGLAIVDRLHQAILDFGLAAPSTVRVGRLNPAQMAKLAAVKHVTDPVVGSINIHGGESTAGQGAQLVADEIAWRSRGASRIA